MLGVVVLAMGGDDDDSGGNAAGSGQSDSGGLGGDGGGGSGGGDIDGFAADLVGALDQQDVDTLNDMACPDANDSVGEAIDLVGQTDGAELVSADQTSTGEYLVAFDVLVEGSALPYVATVVEGDGGLCVVDLMG